MNTKDIATGLTLLNIKYDLNIQQRYNSELRKYENVGDQERIYVGDSDVFNSIKSAECISTIRQDLFFKSRIQDTDDYRYSKQYMNGRKYYKYMKFIIFQNSFSKIPKYIDPFSY